jgi:hypothetical protein
VRAHAVPPLKVQWLRDGQPILGALNWSYTTPALGVSDSGARFSVRIESLTESITSEPVSLEVTP